MEKNLSVAKIGLPQTNGQGNSLQGTEPEFNQKTYILLDHRFFAVLFQQYFIFDKIGIWYSFQNVTLN